MSDVTAEVMPTGQRVVHRQFGYGRVEAPTGGDALAVRFDDGLLASLRPADLISVPEAEGELPKASG